MNNFIYDAPFGPLYIETDKSHITKISFSDQGENGTTPQPTDLAKKLFNQLDQYFKGTLKKFDLPLKLSGTPFQKNVWDALTQIPYGQTQSYKDVAQQINNVKAVRAVGGANNKNPISIVIPCHRVIGITGKLVGFGGGLDTKSWLLNHENKHV